MAKKVAVMGFGRRAVPWTPRAMRCMVQHYTDVRVDSVSLCVDRHMVCVMFHAVSSRDFGKPRLCI